MAKAPIAIGSFKSEGDSGLLQIEGGGSMLYGSRISKKKVFHYGGLPIRKRNCILEQDPF